jgi:hypothetical protein
MLPDLPTTEAAIVEITNAFRKDSALQQVKQNPALTAAARAFAEYLARTETFAHDADGRNPAERAKAQGYSYCLVAENLAMNLDSRGFESRQLAREVVEGWKESPGHRKNLLLAEATDIGVAVVRAEHKHPKFLSVQLFGRPASLKVTFSIENRSGRAVHYTLGAEADRLAPREIVTYGACSPRPLSLERPGEAPARFDPGNGDRFIVRAQTGGAIRVDVERK